MSANTPEFEELTIPATYVRSLVWHGDYLIDWASGGAGYSSSGKVIESRVNWGETFDGAVASPDNRHAVIYTKLATKGLVLQDSNLIREIDRSYYCADAYEYPVTVFRFKGRDILAHCPKDYCRLDFEDLATGELLTAKSTRKSSDFFHSRLIASSDGAYLLSAGWGWHPVDDVRVFHVETALTDPDHLDGDGLFSDDIAEESSAAFLGKDRLIVALRDESAERLSPQLRLHMLDKSAPSIIVETDTRIGTMMPVGGNHILGLYQHPKLIDRHTGVIVKEWPHIASGSQVCSIIWGIDPVPPIALDSAGRRCAIADKEKITVLRFS